MTAHGNRLLAMLLIGPFLVGSGCRQPWKFAPAAYRGWAPVSSQAIPGGLLAAEAQPPAGRLSEPAADRSNPARLPPQRPLARQPGRQGQDAVATELWSDAEVAASYEFAGDPTAASPGGKAPAAATFGLPAEPGIERLPPPWDQAVLPASCRPPKPSNFRLLVRNIRSDYRNYYSWITMRDLLLGVAFASPLANTSLDGDFQGWYQRDVRSNCTDDFSAFWKTFGEGQIFVPAFAGLAVVGKMFEDRPLFGCAGEFGDRVTRGYLVGAPPMLLMQLILGGSRPGEDFVESRWKPFEDNNSVSGHAFMGAVPFITAAQMCQNPWAKGTLYVCSTFTAWSRINDDDHYLSQACLGWWMGYLACRAVDDTQRRCYRGYELTPIATPEITGIGVIWER